MSNGGPPAGPTSTPYWAGNAGRAAARNVGVELGEVALLGGADRREIRLGLARPGAQLHPAEGRDGDCSEDADDADDCEA
jgi:hypothetical protein